MKYTLYVWIADDEGGYAICRAEEFSPKRNFYPESGWRAKPSVKIGDFSTVSELADLLYADLPEVYQRKEDAIIEATEMMRHYKEWEEDEY
jgi:hypothetical protein